MKLCKYCNKYKKESEFENRARCAGCRALQRQEFYKNNRDSLIAKQKEYDDHHVEQKRSRSRRSYFKSKESGLHVIKSQARRAKTVMAPNSLRRDEWEVILLAFNHCCAYCGSKVNIQQEHFIPLSKGGEYTKRNIIPACGRCNNKKKSKMPQEFVGQDVITKILLTQKRYL